MPDLVTQIRAIKATWVVRAQEIEGNWKFALTNTIPNRDINYFLRSNIKFGDIAGNLDKNNTWLENILHWCSANYEASIVGRYKVLDQNIWWNKGLNTIADLCKPNGELLPCNAIIERYKIDGPFLRVQGILSAIPQIWRQTLINNNAEHIAGQEIEPDDNNLLIDKLKIKKGMSKKNYKICLAGKSSPPVKVKEKMGS